MRGMDDGPGGASDMSEDMVQKATGGSQGKRGAGLGRRRLRLPTYGWGRGRVREHPGPPSKGLIQDETERGRTDLC